MFFLFLFYFTELYLLKANVDVGSRMVETLTHSEVTLCQEFSLWSRTSAFTWINLVALNQPGWHLCCWLFTTHLESQRLLNRLRQYLGDRLGRCLNWAVRTSPASWRFPVIWYSVLKHFPWWLHHLSWTCGLIDSYHHGNNQFQRLSCCKVWMKDWWDRLSGKWLLSDHLMLLRLQLFKLNLTNKSHVRARKSEFRGNVQMRKKNLVDGCLKAEVGGCTVGSWQPRRDSSRMKRFFKYNCYKLIWRSRTGQSQKHSHIFEWARWDGDSYSSGRKTQLQ